MTAAIRRACLGPWHEGFDPEHFPDWWTQPEEADHAGNIPSKPDGVPGTPGPEFRYLAPERDLADAGVMLLDRLIDQDRVALTVPEVAQVFGRSESAVRRAIRAGHIPHIRVNRAVLVPTVALRRLLGGA